MRRRRSSGILLSLTSLPSDFGIGGLGPATYRFVDFLQASGQRLWQFLPIHPTTVARGNSPYDAESFFAASTLLIGLTPLIEDGLVSAETAGGTSGMPEDHVDYPAIHEHRRKVWQELFDRWPSTRLAKCYDDFCESNSIWLDDLMDAYDMSQMRLLQLSFSGDPALNPHAPCNYPSANIVAYTGTHDLPPIRGWWKTIPPVERGRIERYVGHPVSEETAAWTLIRLASSSIAHAAIYQMQDVLNFGGDTQMNFPGTFGGNWTWRFRDEHLTAEVTSRLAEVTRIYNRL